MVVLRAGRFANCDYVLTGSDRPSVFGMRPCTSETGPGCVRWAVGKDSESANAILRTCSFLFCFPAEEEMALQKQKRRSGLRRLSVLF
jgi:hypothetical protein